MFNPLLSVQSLSCLGSHFCSLWISDLLIMFPFCFSGSSSNFLLLSHIAEDGIDEGFTTKTRYHLRQYDELLSNEQPSGILSKGHIDTILSVIIFVIVQRCRIKMSFL